MSHRAVNWALEQRHLKPGPWVVLLQLADRHNKDTRQVSPHQHTLAHDCNMSRSTVNLHLAYLEEIGLIRRVQRQNPVTKQQLATHYILSLDLDNPPDVDSPVSEIRTRENEDQSKNIDDSRVRNPDTEPCPKNGQSRVRISDTMNLVREPEEEERARARGEKLFSDFFRELLLVVGFAENAELPAWWDGQHAERHVQRWIDDLGLTEDRILEVAAQFRREKPSRPQGPKALDRAMQRAVRSARGKSKAATTSFANLDAQLVFFADWVKSDRYLPSNAVSSRIANDLVQRGLVSADRMRLRGVI